MIERSCPENWDESDILSRIADIEYEIEELLEDADYWEYEDDQKREDRIDDINEARDDIEALRTELKDLRQDLKMFKPQGEIHAEDQ